VQQPPARRDRRELEEMIYKLMEDAPNKIQKLFNRLWGK
jgi:hypothetical protein